MDTVTTLRAKFNAKIAAQSTARLLDCIRIMNLAEKAGARRDEAENMAFAGMCDELERRLDLGDAMDTIYMDDDYAGTYGDAILTAAATVAA